MSIEGGGGPCDPCDCRRPRYNPLRTLFAQPFARASWRPLRRSGPRPVLSRQARAHRRRVCRRWANRCDRPHRRRETLRPAWQAILRRQPAGCWGDTATAMVAQSPGDGYTLLAVSTSFVVNPSLFSKVAYDPVRDFAPITMIAVSPDVVTVHPSVAAKTITELIDLIKANPGKYSFAAPGVGSTRHLSGEIFRTRFALDLPRVQFAGGGPAIQSTVGGHTPVAFSALASASAQIKEGLLRALAVTAHRRSPTLPEVATMAEAGVPGQEADTLTGMVAPGGTPRAIIEELNRQIVTILAMPEVQKRLDDLGFEVVANSPAEFADRIKSEIEIWAQVIRDAKLKIEGAH